MSITFDCGNCGKSFTIDEKFAGKKGRCKQCGAVMPIPEVAETRAGSGGLDDERFGLDDLPSKPRRTLPIGIEELEPSLPGRLNPPSSRIRGASKASRSRSGGGFARLAIRIAVGVVLGLAGMVGAGAIVLKVVGISSRGAIESILQERVDLNRQLATTISAVNDVPSAREASPQAVGTIKAIAANLRKLKDAKVTKTDLDTLKRQFRVPQELSSQTAIREFSRVASIPGAWEALNIQPALEELDKEEKSIPGIRQVQAPTRPDLAPVVSPSVDNPVVRPRPNPTTRPGPIPNAPRENRPKPGNRRGVNRPNPVPG